MKILVTGSNKGLGLEFVKQYLAQGEEVVATCRNPGKAGELKELSVNFPNKVTILEMEVTIPESRRSAYNTVKQRFGSLDMLINNAAIISGGNKDQFALGEMYREDISRVFNVNSTAPLLMAEQFLDLLEKSGSPKIINISSRMGSISEQSGTSNYSYSASKSALNMFSRMLSNDLKEKGIIVLAFHPGHVQTDMGGSMAPMMPPESIRAMIKCIDSLTIEDTGKFLNWDGKEIPW